MPNNVTNITPITNVPPMVQAGTDIRTLRPWFNSVQTTLNQTANAINSISKLLPGVSRNSKLTGWRLYKDGGGALMVHLASVPATGIDEKGLFTTSATAETYGYEFGEKPSLWVTPESALDTVLHVFVYEELQLVPIEGFMYCVTAVRIACVSKNSSDDDWGYWQPGRDTYSINTAGEFYKFTHIGYFKKDATTGEWSPVNFNTEFFSSTLMFPIHRLIPGNIFYAFYLYGRIAGDTSNSFAYIDGNIDTDKFFAQVIGVQARCKVIGSDTYSNMFDSDVEFYGNRIRILVNKAVANEEKTLGDMLDDIKKDYVVEYTYSTPTTAGSWVSGTYGGVLQAVTYDTGDVGDNNTTRRVLIARAPSTVQIRQHHYGDVEVLDIMRCASCEIVE